MSDNNKEVSKDEKSELFCKLFNPINGLYDKKELFPNNYFSFQKYNNLDFIEEANKFEKIISSAKNELEVQRYIKGNEKWFIPGSIFLDYNFGYHDAYLFTEQKLGNDFVVDYMLIGRKSGGYNLVLIEFEKPNTEYLISTAHMESESVRKGLVQLQDWKRWMDSNREYFMKDIGLRDYGIDISTYKIYYYLVVSRRIYMNKIALEVRSQCVYERHNTNIVTFDRLVDNIRKISGLYRPW